MVAYLQKKSYYISKEEGIDVPLINFNPYTEKAYARHYGRQRER